MKTALVMGITGGFGGHVAQALARQGWAIRAMLRDPAKLPARFRGADVVQGDAGSIEDVRRAAIGVDVIVYGVNPPKYNWDGIVQPLIDNTARVAEENGQTIIFPGNVYVFDPNDGPEFDEQSPIHPVSSRGRMRKEMEERLKLASERGARVIIIRMGDFIAPDAPSTWIEHLISKTRDGYSLATTGPRDLVHTWAYLPDAACAVAELVARIDELAPFNVFHFGGYQVTFADIANAIQEATGKKVRFGKFPWVVIRLLAPFNTMFSGLAEMRYLWTREISLSDRKLQQLIAKPVPNTPLAEALVESGILQA
jgi:nucleoside-diphosphate-sugar epimerase